MELQIRPTMRVKTMMKPESPITLNESAIADICRRYGIGMMALFGSHARGTATDRSDVDLAVWLREGADPDFAEMYADLVPVLDSDRIELVQMHRPNPWLAWDVARQGRLLFASDPRRWHEFQVRAMKEYDDVRRFSRYRRMRLERFLVERGI